MGKKIHGHAGRGKKTTEWFIWKSMKLRCNNPKLKAFTYYGGRGINVCERWEKSFSNFINDMGLRPTPHHSIDRIDVNGNYEPSNCRWATPITQSRNQRVRKNNSSGVSGVTWVSTRNRWCTTIRIPGKRIFIGYYNDVESATRAREEAEIKYWKESS